MPINQFEELRRAAFERNLEYPGADQITPAFRGCELAGEAGEVCNIVKKLERARLGIAGSQTTTADLAAELADVIICVDLLGMHYGIDLWPAVREKFNAKSEELRLQTRIEC